MNLKTVTSARVAANKALEHYRWTLKEVFLPGDDVEISRGRDSYWAEVVAPWPDSHPGVCTSGSDVWVRGRSLKPYRVDAARIVLHKPLNP